MPAAFTSPARLGFASIRDSPTDAARFTPGTIHQQLQDSCEDWQSHRPTDHRPTQMDMLKPSGQRLDAFLFPKAGPG